MEYCRMVGRTTGGDFDLGPIMGELDNHAELMYQLEAIRMEQANARQVGGEHYKNDFQHWDLMAANGMRSYFEAQITKYVVRWKKKEGAQDIDKALHYCEKLMQELKAGTLQFPSAREAAGLGRFVELHGLSKLEEDIFKLSLTYTCYIELGQLRSLLIQLGQLARKAQQMPFPTV